MAKFKQEEIEELQRGGNEVRSNLSPFSPPP
jgi:hypothetical protein